MPRRDEDEPEARERRRYLRGLGDQYVQAFAVAVKVRKECGHAVGAGEPPAAHEIVLAMIEMEKRDAQDEAVELQRRVLRGEGPDDEDEDDEDRYDDTEPEDEGPRPGGRTLVELVGARSGGDPLEID